MVYKYFVLLKKLSMGECLDLFALNVPTDFAFELRSFAKVLRTLLTGRSNSIEVLVFATQNAKISGQRDSNSRSSPWEGDILPLNYARIEHL